MAPAMNCHDAREWFSALLAGELGLTEGIAVETHVSHCAECRQALENLEQMKGSHRGARPHAPLSTTVKPLEIAPPVDAATEPRRRPLLRTLLRLTAVSAALVAIMGLAVFIAQRGLEVQGAGPQGVPGAMFSAEPPPSEPIPTQSMAAPSMPSTEPKGAPAPSGGAAPKEPPAPSAAPPKETERAAPKTGNGSPSMNGPDRAAPSRPLPVPAVAPTTVKPKPNRVASVRAAAPAPAAKRERPPTPASPAKDSAVDVALQLSVKDRGAAERDLTTLLTRVGGTKLGRNQGTIMMVVPQSKYPDFTRGLGRIGAWHMEAGRSSLPDPVRLAVRLTQ
jgi:hypothetical protein